jgi:hypothetical protein
MMIKISFVQIEQHYVKLRYQLIIVFLLTFFILAGFLFLPGKKAFAFWTQLENEKKHPQHRLITDLVQWPNDALFLEYGLQMGLWSETPDGGKPPWGHGNEKGRAQDSLNAAINHYAEYLKNKNNPNELYEAVKCLGRSYHYFEDVGDFSQNNIPLRNAVTNQLYNIHANRNLYRGQIEAKKGSIQPDPYSIFQSLDDLKRQRISDQNDSAIRDGLFRIIACLEQVNVYFLHMVKLKLNSEASYGRDPVINLSCPQGCDVMSGGPAKDLVLTVSGDVKFPLTATGIFIRAPQCGIRWNQGNQILNRSMMTQVGANLQYTFKGAISCTVSSQLPECRSFTYTYQHWVTTADNRKSNVVTMNYKCSSRPAIVAPAPSRNCRDICVQEKIVWRSSDGRHIDCCANGVKNPRCIGVRCTQSKQCVRTEKRCY